MQPIPQDYGRLLGEIKGRIRSAQYEALRKVNRELISLYWDIGRLIVERQRGAGWGKSVVEILAEDLQAEFPGIAGFSARNIWNMRNLFLTYSGIEKLQPLVAEIGWTHNLLVMEKCKDDLEREFYLIHHENEKLPPKVTEIGWIHNLLIRNPHERCRGVHEAGGCGSMSASLPALPSFPRKRESTAMHYLGGRIQKRSAGFRMTYQIENKTIVEYAQRESTKLIDVASYRVVSTLPEELRGQLPAPDQVSKLLEDL